MAPGILLDRNVRPKGGQDFEEDVLSMEEAEDMGSDGESEELLDEEEGSKDRIADDDNVSSDGEDDTDPQINNVSFGALKQAQDALSRKRKRNDESTLAQEDKLEALRKRLRQLKGQKADKSKPGRSDQKISQRAPTSKSTVSEANGGDDDSDSDSAPSEEGAPKTRSKHMPAARSSRHPVTRKRQVIDVPTLRTRDPRFDALHQQASHPGKADKAYSFLRDYQADEISQLKAALKATKDSDDKEKLKRKIGSMENRIRAKDAEERKQAVLRQHRREEKSKVEQGKTPYYLKKSELKERTLVEKYRGMKGKEREKAIEKKRKKEGQKEKRRMPEARRMAG